jgi:hypothetical protein
MSSTHRPDGLAPRSGVILDVSEPTATSRSDRVRSPVPSRNVASTVPTTSSPSRFSSAALKLGVDPARALLLHLLGEPPASPRPARRPRAAGTRKADWSRPASSPATRRPLCILPTSSRSTGPSPRPSAAGPSRRHAFVGSIPSPTDALATGRPHDQRAIGIAFVVGGQMLLFRKTASPPSDGLGIGADSRVVDLKSSPGDVRPR